jgi:hypothetical protein
MKFKNGAKDVTLEGAIKIHNAIGLNFIVEDGRDIVFETEKRTLAKEFRK